jgi:hypothetical protein
VLGVAIDRSADDVRDYVTAAGSTHPVLVDSEHVVADRYGMLNVPTIVWIDERGRIARANDLQFGNDAFIDFHGIPSAPHLEALRRWVVDDIRPSDDGAERKRQLPPTADEQQARACFSLAWYLWRNGREAAATRWFQRAGELAPYDYNIRRAALPIQGKDPMGPDFFELYAKWGTPGYTERPKPKA